MSNSIIDARLQLRNATYEEWSNVAASDVPLIGEPCVTTTGVSKGRMKIGDGASTWGALSYTDGDGSAIASEIYDLVVTTQEELDEMLYSDNWKGATSVAIKGSFQIDNGSILIPLTVKVIHGYDATITFKDFNSNTYGTCVSYEELPSSDGYEIHGLSIIVDGSSGDTTSVMTNCRNVSNMSIKHYNDVSTSVYAITNCQNFDNISFFADVNSVQRYYGFYECSHVSNTHIDITNNVSRAGAFQYGDCFVNSVISIKAGSNALAVWSTSNASNIEIYAEGNGVVYAVGTDSSTEYAYNVSNVKATLINTGGLTCGIRRVVGASNIHLDIVHESTTTSYGMYYCYQCSNIVIQATSKSSAFYGASYVYRCSDIVANIQASTEEGASTSTLYGFHNVYDAATLNATVCGNGSVYGFSGIYRTSGMYCSISQNEGATGTAYGLSSGYQCQGLHLIVSARATGYGITTLYEGSDVYISLTTPISDNTSTLYGSRYLYQVSNCRMTVSNTGGSIYGIYTGNRVSNLTITATGGSSTSYGLRSVSQVSDLNLSLSSGGTVYGLYSSYYISNAIVAVSPTSTDITSTGYAVYTGGKISNSYFSCSNTTGYIFRTCAGISNSQYVTPATSIYTGTNTYIDTETVWG